jgi:hypothetical protein
MGLPEPFHVVPSEDYWVQNFLNAMEGSGALRMRRRRWFEDASWLEKLP